MGCKKHPATGADFSRVFPLKSVSEDKSSIPCSTALFHWCFSTASVCMIGIVQAYITMVGFDVNSF
jgi:hypothetical protein